MNDQLKLKSEAKLFDHLRYYLKIFYGLTANFYHLMLVINSIKPKDHDLTNLFHKTALSMSFLTRIISCVGTILLPIVHP